MSIIQFMRNVIHNCRQSSLWLFCKRTRIFSWFDFYSPRSFNNTSVHRQLCISIQPLLLIGPTSPGLVLTPKFIFLQKIIRINYPR